MSTLETSHQFAFRLAVADLLRTDPRFSEVHISAWPVDLEKLTGDNAWIELVATRMTSTWDLLGNRSTDEQFTLDGRLGVLKAGATPDDQQAIVERTDQLATALQRIIRENYKMPTMAGAIRDCLLATLDTSPLVTPAGLALLVPFQLRVFSQLRYV